MAEDSFSLPNSTHTSPPSPTDSPPTFPRLKAKFTPRVTLPTEIAPQKPKQKAVEGAIKVVAPLGGKIAISWTVNTASLAEAGPLPDGSQDAFEDCIGSWILSNQESLGIDGASWETDESGVDSATSLRLSLVSASPSHSPITTHLIPADEPTATLMRVELAFWWQPQGKRKADELDVNDNGADQVGEWRDGAAEVRAPESSPLDRSPGQPNVKGVALQQIAGLMPEILRRQMIRRFPYVFDGSFLGYREHLQLPPALLTAMNNFAFVAARHRPEFLSQCGVIVTKLEQSRRAKVKEQIKAVALLPVCQRGRKRRVMQDESESQEDMQASRKAAEEAEGYVRAAVAIRAATQGDSDLSARQRLHRLVAEKVSALGTAKWVAVRRKGGRMGASRATVDTPDVDYSQGPVDAVQEGDLSPLQWHFDGSHLDRDLLLAPHRRSAHLPLPIWDDDYDDIHEEDEYFDDLADDLGLSYGRDDDHGDCYVRYREDAADDDCDDDLECTWDEQLQTPLSSPPYVSLHTDPHIGTWRPSVTGPSTVDAFNSLRLYDVPPPRSSACSSLLPPRLDDSVDDGLEDPVDDGIHDETSCALTDDTDDDPDGCLGARVADDLVDDLDVDLHGPLHDDSHPRHFHCLTREDGYSVEDAYVNHFCCDYSTAAGDLVETVNPKVPHPGESFVDHLDDGFGGGFEGTRQSEWLHGPHHDHGGFLADGQENGDPAHDEELGWAHDNIYGQLATLPASPAGFVAATYIAADQFMSCRWEDGDCEAGSRGESNGPVAADSAMWIDSSSSPPHRDGFGSVVDDSQSLCGSNGPPDPMSCSDPPDSPSEQDPFPGKPELDVHFGGGSRSPDSALSRTQPMSVNPFPSPGQSMSLEPPWIERDGQGLDCDLELPFEQSNGCELDERPVAADGPEGRWPVDLEEALALVDDLDVDERGDEDECALPFHGTRMALERLEDHDLHLDDLHQGAWRLDQRQFHPDTHVNRQGENEYQHEQDEYEFEDGEYERDGDVSQDGHELQQHEHPWLQAPPHSQQPSDMVEDDADDDVDRAPATTGGVHYHHQWDYYGPADNDDLDNFHDLDDLSDLDDELQDMGHPSPLPQPQPHPHDAPASSPHYWPTDEHVDPDDLDDLDVDDYNLDL